ERCDLNAEGRSGSKLGINFDKEEEMPEQHAGDPISESTTLGTLRGNQWRTIVWRPKEMVFYGLHWRCEYLFRFDPRNETVEPIRSFNLNNRDWACLGFM